MYSMYISLLVWHMQFHHCDGSVQGSVPARLRSLSFCYFCYFYNFFGCVSFFLLVLFRAEDSSPVWFFGRKCYEYLFCSSGFLLLTWINPTAFLGDWQLLQFILGVWYSFLNNLSKLTVFFCVRSKLILIGSLINSKQRCYLILFILP